MPPPAAASAGDAARSGALRIPIRWRIFGLLSGIGFLAYVQRQSLTVAAVQMMPQMHLSQLQMGSIEGAFILGYAIFQLPGGIVGQRWGARWTLFGSGLLAVVAVGGVALVPYLFAGATLYGLLLALQLLLGVAQAATFPVTTGAFEAWFPPPRWALVQGLNTMCLGLGAAATAPLIASLMLVVGWQQAVLWTSLPALALTAVWAWYARNRPSDHAATTAAERALVAEVAADATRQRLSLAHLLHALMDRNVLLLALSYLSFNYVFYMLSNWSFVYLVQQLHFSVLESGWLATAPPLAAAVGAGVGGVITTRLYERMGARRGLRLVPLLCLPVAAGLLLLAVHAGNPYAAVGALAASFGCIELAEASFWAASMSIGRADSMVVGGLMNTSGNLGGIILSWVIGALTEHGSWSGAFQIGVGCALASAAMWLIIDAGRSVAEVPR